uniref:Uncharacterized protein n=1 Tax=Avena sativa TaxID=4498 RepID=A0ACD5W5U5_AVESA
MEGAHRGSARLKAEDAAPAAVPMAAMPQVLGDGFSDWYLSTQEDEEEHKVKLEQSVSAPFQGNGQIGFRMDERPMSMAEDAMAAAAPQVGDGLMSGYKPWGLSTEEDSLAVKPEQPVEAIQAIGQIDEDKDATLLSNWNMDDDKFLLESGEAAEYADLNMCQVANGGFSSSRALDVTCAGTFYSRDVVCAVDKEAQMSQYQWEGLVDDGGDWGGMADVMASKGDSKTVSEEALCGNEGLLDSVKHGTERSPRMVDGVMFMADGNYELQRDDSMPNTETGVSGLVHQYSSVPSVSGRINVSLNGMADRVGEISGDPVTCHVTDAGLWNKVLLCAPFGGGSQAKYSGCVYDMVDKAPEASQRQEAGLAAEGAVLFDGYNDGFSNSVKFDIQQLPHDMDAMLLKKDGNGELEKDVLLPKIEAKVSSPAHEDSVPSTFGSNLALSLDDKSGGIGEISEHKAGIEKVACCSLGGGMLSRDSGFWKEEALGDEIQFSRMDGCHENKALGHQGSSAIELDCPNHLALELNACKSVVDKPCSVVFIKNCNDEELENRKSESSSVSRRRNPRRSASARNPTLEKHDRIYKGSNSACKSKKVESSCSLVESTMIKFPNKTTKARSGINRPLKSTAWGSLQKLTGGFGQNCEPSTSNSHLFSLENGSSRKTSGKKEQPSIRKTRSSRCSKNKFSPLSAIGFASNDQSTFSVTTSTYASSEGYIGNFPRLDHHALVNGSNDAHKTAECMPIQTGLQQLDRCLESVTQETCPAYICGDFAKSTSEPSLNIAGVGFSPDSVLDVASATCENNTSANHDAKLRTNPSCPAALTENGFHPSALPTSGSRKNHASLSTDLEQWAHSVRGNENKRHEDINPSHAILGYIGEGKVQVLEKSNAARKSKKVGTQERQKKDGMMGKNIKDRGSTIIPSKLRVFSDDSYSLAPSVPPKSGSCFEVVTSATQGISMHEHDSMQVPSVIGKEKTSALDNVKSPRWKKNDYSGGKKDMMWDPYVKGKGMNRNIAGDIFLDSGSSASPSQLVADLAASHMNDQSNCTPATEFAFENSAFISTGMPRNSACITDGASLPQPPRAAWVCCDDCQKWRCIPADFADIIGKTNCRWTCKDNKDKTFSDCSIPQEKTNSEINAELDLSDASADEADNDGSNSKASKAPSWTHARINSFLHRNRRNQSVDESMVCNCKPPQDGRMGCRDGCLNRMLNIECEKRTCPCGEQCSNQQFQRRSYAKISWFHSGKKGYGLQLQEEVSEGRFLIEYVGEVLDITAYESRQRYYASKGQKHFYFMTLNGGEVIDACTKGNLGRFINHSCSPNCRTEKWMVNGEVCIGIFAMRNIKKGEELTFDYNYVRVSGAAPQKCFCGTAKCRGYIGGDISGSGIIAQDDAEAGHFEPMVTYKDADEMLGNTYCFHGANPNILEHETSIQGEDSNNCPPATPDLEPHQQTSPILSDSSEPDNSMEAWSPQDAEDVTRTPVHVSCTIESSLQQFPVYGNQPLEFLEKTPNTIDELTAPNVMNRSTPSSDLGSSLVPGFHAKKKNSLKHHRNVKPPCPIDNQHTLGVEGRLNSLLDQDGGISKRKDATHGYLRLLHMTAADDDDDEEDAGRTSKSIRDLALILEALLQTKSGSVLLDIINMNGLQMLHNILKQNRDHFLRRPIIRKLLKVLEFLASRGILTAEKINEGPRSEGMESFRDSMLKLTWHKDKHVHPIARKFCDKWILPYMDGPANCSTHSYSSRRKRKSRWDYQPESHYKMVGLQTAKVHSGRGQMDLQTSLIRLRSHGNWVTNINHNNVPIVGRSTDGADDDVPPGFEPQRERQPAQASLDCGVAPGFCQGKYLPNLSISYGIPIAIVQHFGTPEVEGTQCGKKWKVAPGVPFNPFPPLPRGSPCPSTSSTQMSRHHGSSTMKHDSSGYRGRGVDRGGRVHRNWRNVERTRFPYDHQGRRFPNNHHRLER